MVHLLVSMPVRQGKHESPEGYSGRGKEVPCIVHDAYVSMLVWIGMAGERTQASSRQAKVALAALSCQCKVLSVDR